jgi:hypothetical protein
MLGFGSKAKPSHNYAFMIRECVSVNSNIGAPDTGYSSNFSLERLSAKIDQISSIIFLFPGHKNPIETYCKLI